MPSYEAGKAHLTVVPSLTGFQRELKTRLAAMNPEVKVRVQPELDDKSLDGIKTKLAALTGAKVKVEVQGGAVAVAQLKNIEELCGKLDGRKVKIKLDIKGSAEALAQITAIRAALNGLGDRRIKITGLDDAGSSANRLNGQLGRTKLLVAGIGAAIPLISSGLLALPGLVSPLVSSVGAVAVGMDGIKKSAERLEPAFDRMQRNVSAVFERGLVPAISDVNRMMPTLEGGLSGSAEATSLFARQITDVVSSRAGLEGINSTFTNSNQIIRDMGPGVGIMTDNFVRLADEGTSALVPMTGLFTQMSTEWRSTIDEMSRTGELEAGIQGLTEVLGSLGNMLPAVVELGNAMTGAFGPTVASGLDLVTGGLQGATEGFRLIPAPVNDGIVAIGGMVLAFKALQKIMATALVTSKIAGASAALNTAALGAAALSQRLGVIGAAAGPAATRGLQGAATAASRIGATLPILGAAVIGGALAWDKFTTNTDEAAQSIISGGKAMHDLKLSYEWTDKIPLIGDKMGTTWSEARDRVREMYQAMSPLQRAQQQVTYYTNEYNYAVDKWGAGSKQAADAAVALQQRIRLLQYANEDAAEAAKDHTQKMFEQQQQMLEQVNATQGYEGALLAIERAQRTAAEAIRDYGAGSLEAREAQHSLTGAQLASIPAAAEAATAAYANKDSLDAQEAATRAANDRIVQLALEAGTNLPPALAVMIAKMGDSELAARGVKIETNAVGEKIAVLQGPGGRAEVVVSAPTLGGVISDLTKVQEQVKALDEQDTIFIRVEQLITQGPIGQAGNQVRAPGSAEGGPIRRYASGGGIVGPGTGTSDSVLATGPGGKPYAVSNGEWVMTAAAVAGAGGFAAMARLMAMLERGKARGFAAGGGVGTSGGDAPALSLQGEIKGGTSETLVESLKDLAKNALTPLADQISKVTNPALAALQTFLQGTAATTNISTGQQAVAHQQLTATVQQTTAAQTAANHLNAVNLNGSTMWMQASIGQLQAMSNTSWQNMAAVTGSNVSTITGPILGGLNAGMAGAQQVAVNTAGVWQTQLKAMEAAAASPIRWIMQFPLGPPGIAASWNELNKQFNLGKHIVMPSAAFATGGPVRGPGTGTSDSITARLSNNEHVWTANEVRRTGGHQGVKQLREMARKGLLNGMRFRSQRDAYMTTGMTDVPPGFADGGAVQLQRGHDWARKMNGRPYILGGNSEAGTDCSGFVGGISRVILGLAPFPRQWATGQVSPSRPPPHFVPGLAGGFSIGVVNGSPMGHTAGTLSNVNGIGGVNVESGGSHGGPKYGGAAVGADSGQFPMKFHLPNLGGMFVSGGGGGGVAFDPGPIVDGAFKKTYDMIGDITRFFGSSNIVTGLQGISRQAADAVKGKAMERIAATMGATAGGPPGAGVERWRGMVNQALGIAGQPMSYADITLRRMNQESGGNPNAVNRTDINWQNGTPSVGLMQVIGPTYAANKHPQHDVGPYQYGTSVNPLANTLASMRYAVGRYGSLPAAYNKPGGYDNGGWLPPGFSTVYNGTRKPEAVFTEQQLKTLTTVGSGPQTVINQQLPHTAGPEEFADQMLFSIRRFEKRKGR